MTATTEVVISEKSIDEFFSVEFSAIEVSRMSVMRIVSFRACFPSPRLRGEGGPQRSCEPGAGGARAGRRGWRGRLDRLGARISPSPARLRYAWRSTSPRQRGEVKEKES